MRAVGEEIDQNPAGVTMQSAAARAGIGTATAYRYFSSLDELLEAYTINTTEELRQFAHECPLTGSELYNAVLSRWITLVLEHGKVMVQLRSRFGYLDRLDRGDPVIAASRAIWEQPLRGLLQDLGLPDTLLRQALFLNNALSDPREILDLSETEKLEPEQIANQLLEALSGSLQGWANAMGEGPGGDLLSNDAQGLR
ncbi:TetR/AcrR family transcriptional regulator [Paenarthrobacter sp. 2TAF44]|uniref:TetR/AcrR family transcriptional regulator n=1 Tax=Paenarthrobacter sp. 2TAF44 TaxID=3233018 RepID=UPI003F95DCE5